jgi:hypothetical protein
MENLLIYGTIFDMLDDLTDEEAGQLFKALNTFRKGGTVEFTDRYLKGIWKGILPNLIKLEENYNKKVIANKENGKKGGRPKKDNNTPTDDDSQKIDSKEVKPIEITTTTTTTNKVSEIKEKGDKTDIDSDFFIKKEESYKKIGMHLSDLLSLPEPK